MDSENFDRLLSKHVAHARSANAIDETRKDFDRVAWGSAGQDQHLKQMWFAGNHSDVGGSYPEVESRLSDIALQWMIEEAIAVPDRLKIGPVNSNGANLPGTGGDGTPLHLYPSAAGVQHCEIAGTRDTLDEYAARLPSFMRSHISSLNYQTIVRKVRPDARLHPTVLERFALPAARQTAREGRYLPEALRDHQDCKSFYVPPAGAAAQSAGRVQSTNEQAGI